MSQGIPPLADITHDELLRRIEIEAATVARGKAARERRNRLIGVAMGVRMPRAAIAAAAGVAEARLYQIRDSVSFSDALAELEREGTSDVDAQG